MERQAYRGEPLVWSTVAHLVGATNQRGAPPVPHPFLASFLKPLPPGGSFTFLWPQVGGILQHVALGKVKVQPIAVRLCISLSPGCEALVALCPVPSAYKKTCFQFFHLSSSEHRKDGV